MPAIDDPLEQFYEWFVAATLIIGMKGRRDREAAIRFAREQFEEMEDSERFTSILDRALNGDAGPMAMKALSAAPAAGR